MFLGVVSSVVLFFFQVMIMAGGVVLKVISLGKELSLNLPRDLTN